MTDWIYESPDGGKTIYRRVLGKHESAPGRQIMIEKDVWFSVDHLIEMARGAYKQQCLRYEYPALNSLWEEYHTMLKLVNDRIS